MSVFTSNCTLPPNTSTYISVNVRSTADIVWSCLSVLVICTWSILHLNVPTQSTPKTKTQKYTRALFRTWTKAKWMLFNLVAPEWALGKAWSDYQSVSRIQRDFEKFQAVDKVSWSRTHTYFANLGAFGIKFGNECAATTKENNPGDQASFVDAAESLRVVTRPSLDEFAMPARASTFSGGIDIESVGGNLRAPALHASERSKSLPVEYSQNDTELGPISFRGSYQHDHVSRIELGLTAKQERKTLASNSIDVAEASLSRNTQRFLYNRMRNNANLLRRRQHFLDKHSRLIGDIHWTADVHHVQTVTTALETVGMHDFELLWEKDRFLAAYMHWFTNLNNLQGDMWILDANQLVLAREFGIIEALPNFSEDELEDRNKADLFVKIIALGQVVWFIIQLGARLGYSITTSPLEIMTLAFAACTSITYLLSLDKPKDVQTPIILIARKRATPKQLIRIAIVGPVSYMSYRYNRFGIPNNALHADTNKQSKRTAGSASNLAAAASCALILFGGIHCIAWNFEFPTETEKILWHASSIITVATLPAYFVILNIVGMIRKRLLGKNERTSAYIAIENMIIGPGIAIFFAARLFIIFEACRTTALLPAAAFRSTWAADIPHAG